MSNVGLKFLLFVTKPYSFSILEPIEKHIINAKIGNVAWFTASTVKDIIPTGKYLQTTREVIAYNPDAILVPGNIVPDNWTGIKVQIFHGLDDEVKGFYDINGQFDLYCTHGNAMTIKFNKLAKKYKYFAVEETGCPKLDPLFTNINSKVISQKIIDKIGFDRQQPILLYAPTFPSKYTSANDLFDEIAKLKDKFQWLVKFHPLMDKSVQQKYQNLVGESFKIIDNNNILPYFEISNILITDTSSVAYEFLPLDRPIITYKALARTDKGVNILDARDLLGAITRSLEDPQEFAESRQYYLNEVHPFTDGKSAERVIGAISKFIDNNIIEKLKRKPLNLIRNCKARKMVA